MQFNLLGTDIEVGDVDGEDINLPTNEVLIIAKNIIDRLQSLGIFPSEVDVDYMGGVAVWYDNDKNKKIWISIMNKGYTSILYITNSITREASKFDFENEFNKIQEFLK